MALMSDQNRRATLPATTSFDHLERPAAKPWTTPPSSRGGPGPVSTVASVLELALEEFTDRWERGEGPRAEEFFDRLPSDDPDGPLELIYHEFCLAASSGNRPEPSSYIERFPDLRDRLLRLIALHDALPVSAGGLESAVSELPETGDEIGPYLLLRELGRGGFARVYLAADADLEDRLLVLKITDRPSAEHRYLARAPHPHIVPILRERTTEDGLQLIFMPFVGGATLADVLDEGRQRPRRPERGLDLLADLDLRAAPEYTAGAPSRPAREILASLNYPQAVAWLIARLAEGLDHAYQRGVTHGDLKPSNILIGGDGQPLLLDFNLSTDWDPSEPSTSSGEAGGTLAYMAPERLRAIADAVTIPPPPPLARHRADLYALGLILREALTGQAPSVPDPIESPRSGRALAGLLAERRAAVEHRSGLGPVPPGLRVILRRCLGPSPDARYATAADLAADLDRWRTGLPLAHAAPPFWVEAARWARRRRRELTAVGLCLMLGLASAAAASVVTTKLGAEEARTSSYRALADDRDDALTAHAHDKVERYWSDAESGAYAFWRYAPGQMTPRAPRLDFIERVLDDYQMLDADAPDFWDQDDVARLDEPDRSDLRAWLMEQALLYGLEYSRTEFSAFPDEQARALELLERVASRHPAEAIERTAALLRIRLGLDPTARHGSAGNDPARWLDEYLSGVLAESIRSPGDFPDEFNVGPTGYLAALRHYRDAVAENPGSYWARYRLGIGASSVDEFETARDAFQSCLERRPDCPALWLGMATCRYYLGDWRAAIADYENVIRRSPNWSVGWRDLGIMGARVGFPELVTRAATRLGLHRSSPRKPLLPDFRTEILYLTQSGPDAIRHPAAPPTLEREIPKIIPTDENLGLAFDLALELQTAGRVEQARALYSELLDVEPHHIEARFNRAIISQRLDESEAAISDYRKVFEDPNYDLFVAGEPAGFLCPILLSADQIRAGRLDEAESFAASAAKSAEQHDRYRGEAYYALARVHAAASESDPARLHEAVKALEAARAIHPDYIKDRFHADPLFRRYQAEIGKLMDGIEF